jgi:hypothetical protein
MVIEELLEDPKLAELEYSDVLTLGDYIERSEHNIPRSMLAQCLILLTTSCKINRNEKLVPARVLAAP